MSGKRPVFSLGGRKLGTVGSGERIVKYTSGHHQGDKDDDLEDIAIVSNADMGEVTYGGGQASSNYIQSNGPRVVPGLSSLFYSFSSITPFSPYSFHLPKFSLSLSLSLSVSVYSLISIPS